MLFLGGGDITYHNVCHAHSHSWSKGLSAFERQAKAQVDDRQVSAEEFMSFQAQQVLPFPEEDIKVASFSN